MEKGKTRLGNSYWDNTGYYQDIYDRLYDNLVPSNGDADTIHGELIRCIGRLYYDFCNNGNINAVDTEYENEEYPCYSCNGDGETEDEEYNDETEEYETTTITCDDCGGDGELSEETQGDPFITEYYQNMIDFLSEHIDDTRVVDGLEKYMLENHGFYKYDNESMNIYDKVSDEVIWACLNTENRENV